MGLLLGRFALAGGGPGTSPLSPSTAGVGGSESRVAALQARLRSTPDDPMLLAQLGVAYLGRARETADAGDFTRAAQAVERSHALDGDAAPTLTALGLVALARHEFPAALDFGNRAHALAPDSADPLGVIVDAQVDLGRYDDATLTAQRMVDRRPGLPSFARVSYLRELHGDTDGAITAMTQAVVAGAGSGADTAYVQTLLGDLQLGRGDLGRAEAAYRLALHRQPAYGDAEFGLARVAAARGDLAGAARQLEDLTARLPQPAWVALLGDVLAAQGRTTDAAAQFRLVRQMEELNRANGVIVDLEVARFEADHARDPGADPEVAVGLARSSLVQRPTVFGEDAMAWALRQAGRPEEALPHARAAVRLGTADALLWYHLAAVEADLGLPDAARTDLSKALSLNPHLTVRDLPDARALATRLGL